MRTLSSSVIRTVEIELAEDEIVDLDKARVGLREMQMTKLNLTILETKALEDSIYLISTVLGNHQ